MTFAARPMMGYTPTYSGTMTQGNVTDGSTFNRNGFVTAVIGSISPAGLSDGATFYSFQDETVSGQAILEITIGYNPGAAYFNQITGHGTTKNLSAATYLGWSGGVATWTWSSLFGFAGSGTTGVTVS